MRKAVSALLHHHHHPKDNHKDKDHTDHVDSSGMVVNRKVETPVEETVVRSTIVEELPVEEQVVEIQPVIHRVIEVPEVHHIERHVYEKVPSMGPTTITKEPIVEVTIQPRIIEEVTTIVHREVPEVEIVHEEQHISEHQTRATIHTKAVYNDVSSIETATTDSHLRAIAEPHERVPPALHKNIAVEEARTKWVAAYPKAMLQPAHHNHTTESKHVDHKHADTKKVVSDKHEHKEEKKEKGKEKIKEEIHKEPVKEGSTTPPNPTLCLTPEISRAGPKEPMREQSASHGVTLALTPEKIERQDPFDNPVFVHHEVEHSSLDIRAMLSLERRADLQAQESFGELPAFSGKPHFTGDRDHEDLEKGSTIGLDTEAKQQHLIGTTTQPTLEEQTTTRILTPPRDKSPPTKLEKELRSHNKQDLAGAFVATSLRPEH